MDDLLNTLENERRYVAKELHDGVAQTTLQLGLQAGICRKLLERGKVELLSRELAELETRILLASNQVRQMIADMRPPQLEPDADLKAYLQQAINTHLERKGPFLEFRFDLSSPLHLSEQQLLGLTRIVQEALLNIRKHAQAQIVRLTVAENSRNICITIADNGKGFDPAEVEALPLDRRGAGLTNLGARAEALGGSLTLTSHPSGAGTEITVTLPKSKKRRKSK